MPTQGLSKRKAPVKGKPVTVGKKCQGEVDFNSDLSCGCPAKGKAKNIRRQREKDIF